MVAEGGTRKSSMHRASRVTSSTTPRRATSATPRRATTQTSGSSYTPIAGGRSSTSFSASKTRWSLRTSRHNTTPMSTGKGHRKTSEPRPVTDKAYVKASIAKLGAFLRARGYGGASTAAALGRPTGRDFEDMSCFLFTQLDARWARDASRKFDDDFVDMFKRLHYPFGISRTALAAVGTAHTWPPLLAALLWLADLISFDEGSRDRPVAAAHASRRLALSEADEVVAGDDHVASRLAALGADRVFYEYIGDAYGLFLSGDDAACDELQAKLEAAFQSRVDDGEREEQTFLARARELEVMRARTRDEARGLPELLEKRALAREQQADAEARLADDEAAASNADADLAAAVAEAAALKLEADAEAAANDELRALDAQREADAPLVARLKRELEGLEAELQNRRAARRSSDEFRELVDAERSLADALLEIEAVAVVYGESAAKLQVVPKTAKNAGGVDLSLAVDARTAARLIAAADAGDRDDGSPAALRAAVDAALATATKARDVVAPKLEELREVLADRVRDVAESRDAAQLEVERSSLEAARLKERLEDKVADVRNLEARLAEETARAADAKARDDADEAALLHKVEAARADAHRDRADLDDRSAALSRGQALDEAAAAKRAAARADKRRALGRALDDAAALAARRVAVNANLRRTCAAANAQLDEAAGPPRDDAFLLLPPPPPPLVR